MMTDINASDLAGLKRYPHIVRYDNKFIGFKTKQAVDLFRRLCDEAGFPEPCSVEIDEVPFSSRGTGYWSSPFYDKAGATQYINMGGGKVWVND